MSTTIRTKEPTKEHSDDTDEEVPTKANTTTMPATTCKKDLSRKAPLDIDEEVSTKAKSARIIISASDYASVNYDSAIGMDIPIPNYWAEHGDVGANCRGILQNHSDAIIAEKKESVKTAVNGCRRADRFKMHAIIAQRYCDRADARIEEDKGEYGFIKSAIEPIETDKNDTWGKHDVVTFDNYCASISEDSYGDLPSKRFYVGKELSEWLRAECTIVMRADYNCK